MKAITFKSTLFLLLICSGGALHSQITAGSNIRIIPGISFGYTLGHGINLCANLGASFIDYQAGNMPCYSGIDVSLTVFSQRAKMYKSGYFITKAFSLLNVMNDQVITRIGINKTYLKWGMNNRNTNRSKKWGPNIDLGFAPKEHLPYIGYRFFMPANACLGLNNGNPKFIYAGYIYPVMIYREDPGPIEQENFLGL